MALGHQNRPARVLPQIAPHYILLLDSLLQRATREEELLIVLFCTDECNLGTFDSLILFTVVVLFNFPHLLLSHFPPRLGVAAPLGNSLAV